jgi:hypothetical protein
MKEHSEKNPLPEAKADDKKLRTAFAEVVPGFDSERVYNSDIKKMFAWFHMVKDFVATPDEEAKATEEPANEESAS